MSRDPLLFLEDIEKSCDKVLRYTEGRSKEQVFGEEVRADAVLLNLHVIGEAVKNLPAQMRQQEPKTPWRQIAGMRDVLAHAYFGVDVELVWDIVANHLGPLRAAVERLLVAEQSAGE